MNLRNKRLSAVVSILMLLSVSLLTAAEMRLSAGGKFQCRLMQINDNNVYYIRDNQQIFVPLENISSIVCNNDTPDSRQIYITCRDGKKFDGELVAMTKDAILYQSHSNIDLLREMPLSRVANIQFYGVSIDRMSFTKETLSETGDVMTLTQTFLGLNEDDPDWFNPDYHNVSFYDKYWLHIGNYVSRDTSSLLWKMIELYTDKENILAKTYYERLNSEKERTELRISELTQELQNQIYNLRIEFAERSYRMIVNAN